MKELPPGWADATFGDIADYISRGKSPKYAAKSSLPVVNQKAIRWFGIQDEHLKFVHEEQFEHWSFERFISNGDILWNSTGTGTIGRACLVKPENLSPKKVVDSHVTIVRPNQKVIDPRYLFAWIRGPEVQGIIEDLATGTTNQIELNRSTIAATHVPVAPINEQKRIADKLDAVLARVDACREHFDRIPVILKRFRQSVLAAATSGKLTEDWTDQTAPTSSDLSTEQGLFDIPKHWAWSFIGNHVDVKGGKRLPKGEKLVLEDTGFPYIKAGQLKYGTVQQDGQEYLPPNIQKYISQYTVDSGDVYITIVGACIGDAGIIPANYDKANLTENAAKLCNFKGVMNEYLAFWLQSPIAQNHISFLVKSGAQGKLALMRIKEIPIPLPSLAEQGEIIRRVQSLQGIADLFEVRYGTAHQKIERLTPALLSKAFRGELVPQDPNDEPASLLLERIRATRTAEPAKSRTKRGAGRAKKTQKTEVIMLQRHEIKETHLTSILKERGPLTAEALWSASHLDIDDFYDQLKVEEEQGFLQEQRSDSFESPRLLEAAA